MKKKVLCVILSVAICLICPLTLSGCSPTEHFCTKCNGTGKIRDPYGYYAYVTCDWCHGAGYMYY